MPYADPERQKEYQKKYREANRAKKSEYMKEYYQEHRDVLRAQQSEYMKEYYQEHRDVFIKRAQDRQKTLEGVEYRSKHYQENKERICAKQRERYRGDPELRERSRENFKANRHEKRAWLDKLKADSKCKYCNETWAPCLDFHHRDPSQKVDLVSRLVQKAASMKRILEEVSKCDIVCANCHRKIHSGALLETKD